MTASLATVLWCLAAPAVLGIALLRALGVRAEADRIAYPAWAWVLGCLGLGATVFACLALGVAPGHWHLAVGAALAIALAAAWRAREPAAPPPPAPARATSPPGWRSPYGIFVAVLVALSALRIAAATANPVLQTDEATLWALMAKMLYATGNLGPDLAAEVRALGHEHPDYPLFNPMLQAWVFSQAGGMLHFENRLPVQFFAPALLLLAASTLRRLLHPAIAAALLLLLFDTGVFRTYSQRAHAEIMVATGWVMALSAWLRHRDGDRSASWWMLGCAGLALAAWSKHETKLYLAAGAAAWGVDLVLAWRRGTLRFERAWLWLLLPAIPLCAQAVVTARLGFHNDLLGNNARDASMLELVLAQWTERTGPVLGYAASHGLSLDGATRGLYVAWAAALICMPWRLLQDDLRAPTLLITLAMIGHALVYIGSWHDLDWHLATSSSRVVFCLLPFTVVWLALVAGRAWPRLAARTP